MTTTLQIIAAFLAGTAVSNIFFWIIHTKQKRAWQTEYRRLMEFISAAMICLEKPGVQNSRASEFLNRAYSGEI